MNNALVKVCGGGTSRSTPHFRSSLALLGKPLVLGCLGLCLPLLRSVGFECLSHVERLLDSLRIRLFPLLIQCLVSNFGDTSPFSGIPTIRSAPVCTAFRRSIRDYESVEVGKDLVLLRDRRRYVESGRVVYRWSFDRIRLPCDRVR